MSGATELPSGRWVTPNLGFIWSPILLLRGKKNLKGCLEEERGEGRRIWGRRETF